MLEKLRRRGRGASSSRVHPTQEAHTGRHVGRWRALQLRHLREVVPAVAHFGPLRRVVGRRRRGAVRAQRRRRRRRQRVRIGHSTRRHIAEQCPKGSRTRDDRAMLSSCSHPLCTHAQHHHHQHQSCNGASGVGGSRHVTSMSNSLETQNWSLRGDWHGYRRQLRRWRRTRNANLDERLPTAPRGWGRSKKRRRGDLPVWKT